jgi:hypothetical protein
VHKIKRTFLHCTAFLSPPPRRPTALLIGCLSLGAVTPPGGEKLAPALEAIRHSKQVYAAAAATELRWAGTPLCNSSTDTTPDKSRQNPSFPASNPRAANEGGARDVQRRSTSAAQLLAGYYMEQAHLFAAAEAIVMQLMPAATD